MKLATVQDFRRFRHTGGALAVPAMLLASVLSPMAGMFVRLLPDSADMQLVAGLSFMPFLLLFVCRIPATLARLEGERERVIPRAFFCGLSVLTTFAAVRRVDFATVYFVNMAGPIIALSLSRTILGESWNPFVLASGCAMLLGALLALSPSPQLAAEDLILLASVLGSCVGLVLSARATGRSSNAFAVTITAMASVAVPFLPLTAIALTALPKQALLVLVLASTANFLAICLSSFAYSKAATSVVAPFELFKVCIAVLIGWIVFSTPYSALQTMGSLLIGITALVLYVHTVRSTRPTQKDQAGPGSFQRQRRRVP